jgi:hypothetical protein
MMTYARFFPLLMLFLSANCVGWGKDPAIEVVAQTLGENKLGVTASHLHSLANPAGDGTFVYVPETRFHGVERYIIWLVLDGQAYPLNGATKGTVTPTLPWPREASEAHWARTGLDPYTATGAIKIVFGESAL